MNYLKKIGKVQTFTKFYFSHNTINMELRKLTIEELRAFEGLESLSDEEAKEVIETLFRFSMISYQIISEYGED